MPASALLSYTSLLHSHPTLLCKCRVARGEIDRDAWEFICHTCVNLLCSIQKCCLIHFFAGNQCSKEEKGPTDNRTNIWMRVIAKNSLALKTHKSDICAPSKLFNVHGNTDYAEVGPIKATFGRDMYTSSAHYSYMIKRGSRGLLHSHSTSSFLVTVIAPTNYPIRVI